MKILLTIFLGLSGLASGITIAEEGDPSRAESKVIVCGACHGGDGNSAVSSNPKLAGQGEKYLLKQMREFKAGLREAPLMTGVLNNFDDQDLVDIAAFYASKEQTKSVAKAEWVDLGREIYRAGIKERGIASCIGCHGPSGLGNAPAGFPMLSGQHAEYTAQQLRNFSVGTRTNDGDSKVMRDIAERMNENEIKAVASYIAGLRP